jgi:ATPase subunit of ABC transporter with duplicated ATPase domains
LQIHLKKGNRVREYPWFRYRFPVPFEINIPKPGAPPLQFAIDLGEIVFVLGANGTGKSTLMQSLYRNHGQKARWVSAHRQNWFESDSIDLSPQGKRNAEQGMRNFDTMIRHGGVITMRVRAQISQFMNSLKLRI